MVRQRNQDGSRKLILWTQLFYELLSCMTVLSGFYGNNPSYSEGDPAGPSKSWADICCSCDAVVGGNMRTDKQPGCVKTNEL